MSIYEKLQEEITSGLTAGVEASKKLFEKTKAAAVDMEENSVIRLDLRKLRSQKKELIIRLGQKAHEVFLVNGRKSLSASSAGVGELIEELKMIEAKIVEKEALLKEDSPEADADKTEE